MLYVSNKRSDSVVFYNDFFFNKYTYTKILSDEILKKTLCEVEGVVLDGEKIRSKFTDEPLAINFISTGCKTLLNIMSFPDKTFYIEECGNNILPYIYSLKEGRIFSSFPYVPYSNINNSISFNNSVYSCTDDLLEAWEGDMDERDS